MNINKDGMVPLQSIYDDVISHYNWQNYDESKRRLLRKKYAFLQRNLVLCSPSEFKSKGDNVIPLADAAIVRDILIEAVNDGEDNMIYDWFNGRVDTTDSLKAKLLFMCMKPVIMRSNVMTGETDDVTADEWLNTVSAALNANTADNTLRLKRHLEEFRNSSLALNMNISVGDITVTHADGHRSYGLRGQKPSLDIRGKTIDEILETSYARTTTFRFWIRCWKYSPIMPSNRSATLLNGMLTRKTSAKLKKPMMLWRGTPSHRSTSFGTSVSMNFSATTPRFVGKLRRSRTRRDWLISSRCRIGSDMSDGAATRNERTPWLPLVRQGRDAGGRTREGNHIGAMPEMWEHLSRRS